MTESGGVGALARRGGAFLIVGGVAFLVDALTFNLLVFGWTFTGGGPLYDLPLLAKVIAIVIATVVTYVGNRYWTFGSRQLERRFSRYVVFVLLNLAAIAIQLACLAFSRYVLGLDGIVADNVSGTLVGQALATLFRFFTYDRWVFPDESPAQK
ncbi:MAG: GtrA family protein [Microbacterium sp.]